MAVDIDHVKSRTEVSDHLAKGIADERIRQFILKNLARKGKEGFEWRLNLKAISENLEKMFDGIPEGFIYKGPTLFIKGGESDYILSSDYQQIFAYFPYTEIITIDKGTHWLHADKPEEFFNITNQFLK
jgi:pimeloyl-ACP methyl ester carboxylesterase